MLEMGGGWEQHIRIARCIGQQLLVNYGEEIVSGEASEHARLIRRDDGRIGVVYDHRLHRRIVKLGERVAELVHVDGPDLPTGEQIGASKCGVVHGRIAAVALHGTTAHVAPGSYQTWQAGDRPNGHSAVIVMLKSIPDTYERGTGSCVFPAKGLHDVCWDAGDALYPLWRILSQATDELVEANGVLGDVLAIVEAVTHDNVHHAKSECSVRAGPDLNEAIGEGSGAVAVDVDMDERGTVPLRFADVAHLVHVDRDEVAAPADDVTGPVGRLGIGTAPTPDGERVADVASYGADGPVELAAAEAVEEPSVHAADTGDAHRASEAVGQNRLGTMLMDDGLEPLGDDVERVIPGDPLELALALRAYTSLRVEHSIRAVDALDVTGSFAADGATGDWMIRIARDAHDAAVLDIGKHAASIRAIVRTDGTTDLKLGHRDGSILQEPMSVGTVTASAIIRRAGE